MDYPSRVYGDIKTLFNLFGLKFMCFVMVALHLLKGCGSGLVGIPILFLLRTFKELNSVHIQVLRAVAMAPFTLKSLMGIISDTVYIAGYNKLPYLCTTLIPSILSCIIIAVMWPLSHITYTILLFIIFLHLAVVDLLTEAKYSEKIAIYPDRGPQLVSFVWVGIFVGQLLAIIVTGIFISSVTSHDLHYIYFLPAFLIALSIIPTFGNWIGDTINIGDGVGGSTITTTDRVHVKNLLCNSLWIEIPRSYSTSNNVDDYYKQKSVSDCLLCKTFIEDDHVEERVSRAKVYIESLHGVIENDDIASRVCTTYLDSMNTKETVLAHLQGVHTLQKKEDAIDDRVMILPFIGVNKTKIGQNWQVFTLALIIGSVSLITSALGLFQIDPIFLCGASILFTIIIIIAFYVLIDRRIAKIQSFNLIQNMFSVSISTAVFFFFTDTVEQYPEGPHFSTYFYITVMGTVSAVCSILGLWGYDSFMKNWTYRTVLIVNNILYMVISLCNVFLYMRWNVKYMGIPDYVFVLGTEVLEQIVSIWTYIPMTVMMSHLCPPGMESTMFAILAGSSNLGNSFAQYQGAFLLKVLNITPNGSVNESAKFDNLWIASIISSVLPCIPLILVCFLIPNAYQTQSLLVEGSVQDDDDDDFEKQHQYII
jgi:hypothetical protein